MKTIIRLVLCSPLLFVLAVLFGVGLFYGFGILVLVSPGHQDTHSNAGISDVVITMITIAGIWFFIPSFLSASLAAALLYWPRFRPRPVFALVSAGIAAITFYIYLMLCQPLNAVRARAYAQVDTGTPFSFPSDTLVLIIAPIAFAGAAFVSCRILRSVLPDSSDRRRVSTNDA